MVRSPVSKRCSKEETISSARSMAWAMTSPAPSAPSTTTAARKNLVARAYLRSRGSIGFT